MMDTVANFSKVNTTREAVRAPPISAEHQKWLRTERL
jgi:hypothetical protein